MTPKIINKKKDEVITKQKWSESQGLFAQLMKLSFLPRMNFGQLPSNVPDSFRAHTRSTNGTGGRTA